MNAIQPFVPREVVKTIATFLNFCYIARRNIITEDSLEQLNAALKQFHKSRTIFMGTARQDDPSAFSLPRQHSMVHYHDLIKDFGSPNGLCSSITESKHIVAVKRPWRRTNKHMALPQMLKINERLDKIAAARVDFASRNMLTDSCLSQALVTSMDGSPTCEDTGEENSDSETDSELYDIDIHPTRSYHHPHPQDHFDDGLDGSTPDDDRPNDRPDDDRPDYDILDDDILDDDILDDDDCLDSSYPQPPSANEEDDECGPVESGPLMNEVRFIGRKGKFN